MKTYKPFVVKSIIGFGLSLMFLVLINESQAYPGGYSGRTCENSDGCGGCHGSSSSTEVSVSVISGSGSFTVEPGSTTTFTTTISTTNLNMENAGVNLAVKTDQTSSPGTNVGTLIPGTGLRLRGTPQEITQSTPLALSGGSASWDFQWTAPTSPGTYYLRILGFCGDGDGNDDADDRWNWMTVREITVQAVSSIDLTAPNGGQEYCAGVNIPVQWTVNDVNFVRIELSSDGGSSWPVLLINNFDAAVGQWIWNVPDDQASGNQYRIRILDALNYSVNDASESNFTIHTKTGLSEHPQNSSLCAGGTAIFRVTASGQNLEYQWRKDGVDILNATLPTLYVNNAAENDEGEYRCMVKGLCDSVLSDIGILDIKDSPKVISDPVGDTLCMGYSITLSVEATGVGLNYAWSLNGQHIVGSNVSELQLKNITLADSGIYKCIVSGACQPKDTSAPAHLVVYTPVRIISMPGDEVVPEGEDFTFTVNASGTDINYQWRKDGVDIVDSTNNTLSFMNVTKADTGVYTCVVSNRCGQIITKEAKLIVLAPEKPIIELSIKNLDFGNVSIGRSGDTLLANLIRNNSKVALIINSIKIIGRDAGDFNYFGINLPMTIPAEEYRNLNLEFVPGALGAKTASVTFNTNAENVVSLSLIGYGTELKEDLTATDWDYGEVLVGSNSTSENIIKNIGTDSVIIQTPVVMSYDSLNFKLLDDEDYPLTLQAGEEHTVNFMFIPTIAKSYEVQVLVENSSGNDLWFKLKGSGVTTHVTQDFKEGIIIKPNPADDYISILIPENMLVNEINITDIFGNNVMKFYNFNNIIKWNLRNLQGDRCAPGIYFISIKMRNNIINKKLIVN